MANWRFVLTAFLFLIFSSGLNAESGYQEFNYIITHTIISSKVISDKSVFVFTNFSIIHFNGTKWRVIKSDLSEIVNADTDGEYIIADIRETGRDYVKPCFILMKFNGDVITEVRKLKIPMTHASTSIKFISQGKALIGGLFEYCFISIDDDSVRYKIFNLPERFIGFSHYVVNFPAPMLIFNSVSSIYGLFLSDFSQSIPKSSYFDKFFADVISGRVKPEILTLFKLDSITSSKFLAIRKVIPFDSGYVFTFESGGFGFIKDNLLYVPEFIRVRYGSEFSFVDVKNEYVSSIDYAGGNVFYAVLKSGEVLKVEISEREVLSEILNLNIRAVFVLCSDKKLFVIGRDKILSIPFKVLNTFTSSSSSTSISKGNFIFNINRLHIGSSYGIAVSDANKDGFEDVFIVDVDALDYFYDGRYFKGSMRRNVSMEVGLSGRNKMKDGVFDADVGVCAGDINNDGYDDFVVSYISQSNCVYLNKYGYFRDVTQELGLDIDVKRSEHASISDVNCDGWVDVFMTSFYKSNRLFINNSGHKFDDKTSEFGLVSDGRTICSVFGDINNDGYPDLYIGNWTGGNKMYLNKGDGTFIDFTSESGTGGDLLMKTNSAMFADFDNDGDLDLFVGNRGNGNKLFLNDGNGKFRDVTMESGLFDPEIFTYGCTSGDYDNDGLIDIFIVYLGGIKLYKNIGLKNGVPNFVDVTEDYIRISERQIVEGYNTCCVSSDFNGDGDLDIFVSQNNGISFYLENLTRDISKDSFKNFIKVKVIGLKSNASGIDSKVRLFKNGKFFGMRYVVSGSGYASSESKILHFGLGDVSKEDEFEIEVEFPMINGEKTIKRMRVKPGQFVEVYEFDGFKAFVFKLLRFLNRDVNSREFKIEIAKISFLIVLIFIYLSLYLKKVINPEFGTGYRRKIWLWVLIPVLSYIIARIIIWASFELSFQPYYWISGRRSYLFNDIIPVSVYVLVFVLLHLSLKKQEKISSARAGLYSELITKIEEFEHSAQKSSILTRISLLIQNLEAGDNELELRLFELLDEYRDIVQPDLESISNISDILSLKFERSVVEKLNAEISNLLNKKSRRSLDRERSLIPSLISKLRTEINKLREEVFSGFVTNVERAISDVLRVSKCDFIKFKPNSENMIIFNRDDFISVMSIVLQNSIEAVSDVKNPEININVVNFDGYVEVHIVDNGPGVDDNTLERINSGGYSTKPHGHGFGLLYVKRYLRRYGGEMKILGGEKGFHIVLKFREAIVKSKS